MSKCWVRALDVGVCAGLWGSTNSGIPPELAACDDDCPKFPCHALKDGMAGDGVDALEGPVKIGSTRIGSVLADAPVGALIARLPNVATFPVMLISRCVGCSLSPG